MKSTNVNTCTLIQVTNNDYGMPYITYSVIKNYNVFIVQKYCNFF